MTARADVAFKRIDLARADIQRWKKDIQKEKAQNNQRHDLVQFGGPNPMPANPKGINYEDGRPKNYEGRRVGMDFFLSPRGPPGDLRLPKDRVPGKHGLAGEFAGNREKDNPWEWNCQWEEMGIPGETRVALGLEVAADLARGAPQRRVVQDRGIYPAVQGEGLRKEAERQQKEFAIERGRLLAARMAQAVEFDGMRDQVLQGRIRWERNKGQWAIKGALGDDMLIVAARKGIELLNETAYDYDRPAGNRRPHRQHEMLSQLARAPTVRDLDQIPRPNPPYAWVGAQQNARDASAAAAAATAGAAHEPHARTHEPNDARYPARVEWDVRSLMRGERRSVAVKRAARAQEKGSADASHPPPLVHPQEFVLEGCVERADDTAPQPTMRLVGSDEGGGNTLKVLYPGGKRWRNDQWEHVGAVLVTVRHAPNKNFGLNPQLLQPHADLGRGADGAYVDVEGLSPVEVELALNPTAQEISVFHHMGQLVEEATQQFGGQAVKVVHGGSFLAPDRRHGVVSVEPPPTGKVIGGGWKWGDCGAYGGDGKLLGRVHPFRDGNGDVEEHGAAVMCNFRIAPNPNYGLNRHLLNPPPPEQGEKVKFVDCGDGRVEAAFRNVRAGPVQNRRAYRRDDLRPVSACNTFCHR